MSVINTITKYIFVSNDKAKEDILCDFVNEIKTLNSSFPYINQGGCGIIAELLYDSFKNLGFNPTIGYKVHDINEFNHGCKNYKIDGVDGFLEYMPFGIPHIIIVVDGKYIDSTGVYDDHQDMEICPYISNLGFSDIDLLRALNRTKHIWNSNFDREYIPHITNKVSEAQNNILNKVK